MSKESRNQGRLRDGLSLRNQGIKDGWCRQAQFLNSLDKEKTETKKRRIVSLEQKIRDVDRSYTYRVLGCVYEVYKQLGPGLLESIYEEALIRELRSQGFEVRNQVQVPVYYKGELICPDLRLDLIIDGRLILELKSVTEYRKLFEKQLLTYLRLMDCELGYVINFNSENIREDIFPVYNNRYTGSKG